MRFSGKTRKGKQIEIYNLTMLMSIGEIDILIDFLKEAKKYFDLQQNNASITCFKRLNGESVPYKMTKYMEIVESGNKFYDEHIHFMDWCKKAKISLDSTDVEIHTIFTAQENEDGSFHWTNEMSINDK